MAVLLNVVLAWLAFLHRPFVLEQLLLSGGWLLVVLQLRRHWLPARRLPRGLLPLAGLVTLALLLSLTAQRNGLVLLAAQVSLGWLLLGLLEGRVLRPRLPAVQYQLLVSRLLRPCFFALVLLQVLQDLGSLDDLADLPLGIWFGSAINLGDLAQVLALLYLLLVGMPLPSAWLSALLKHALGLTEGSRRALDQILQYTIVALGLIWALQRLGINQTGLLAIAGGFSVGLGFGIKEVFSNIVSGLWLLIEGSVRPGEVLIHDDEACEVRRLGPRATTLLRSSDNAELVVPNQTFFTTATTTYTRSDRLRRCTINLAVPRRWPPEQIVGLLESIAATLAEVLADPPPQARLQEFGPDRYHYSLTVSINDPLRAGAVSAALRLAICRSFDDQGVDPPC
ncbi:MAG: mechanosensitive ion channel [Cyanobacteria bacterium]|nr:mechanosensitive ion channel [Cyanobacteriota bacterium]